MVIENRDGGGYLPKAEPAEPGTGVRITKLVITATNISPPPTHPDNKEDKMEYLIVTRHKALVSYLAELGITGEVVAHATPDNVRGRHVIGVLPHSLSCMAASFSEVPLRLPAELRGKELTLEQVRRYAGPMVTYKVTVIGGNDV